MAKALECHCASVFLQMPESFTPTAFNSSILQLEQLQQQ